MTRAAFDRRITAHQECMVDGKPCLSAAVDSTETARVLPTSPARRQIVNHLNWSASFLRGHNVINPPTTGFAASTKKTGQELSPSSQIFTPFSSNARDFSKGIEATQSQRTQDWGLSVALNYPPVVPVQTPGLLNVLPSSFGQSAPHIDWSMAVIAKTNFSTPFPSRWAP